MELGWALLIWLIVLLLVFFIARRYRIRMWSAATLAVLIAAIVLTILRPPNTLPWGLNQSNGLAGLYFLIMFITPLWITIYVVARSVTDVEPEGLERVASARRASLRMP